MEKKEKSQYGLGRQVKAMIRDSVPFNWHICRWWASHETLVDLWGHRTKNFRQRKEAVWSKSRGQVPRERVVQRGNDGLLAQKYVEEAKHVWSTTRQTSYLIHLIGRNTFMLIDENYIEFSISIWRHIPVVNTKLWRFTVILTSLHRWTDVNDEWGMNATTIPVVIGALGLSKKGLEKYIQQIPGNIKIHELQKITLLGTPRILRKALSIK